MRWSTGAPLPPHGSTGHKKVISVTSDLTNSSESDNPPQPKAKSLECLLSEELGDNVTAMHIRLEAKDLGMRSNGMAMRASSVPPSSTGDGSDHEEGEGETLRGSNSLVQDDGGIEQAPTVPPRTASLGVQQPGGGRGGGGDTCLVRVSERDKCSIAIPKQKFHAYEEIEFLTDPPKDESEYDHLTSVKQESVEYDHLFPTKKQHKMAIRNKEGRMKAKKVNSTSSGQLSLSHSPVRRNESMPPLSSAEKPRIRVSDTNKQDLSDSDQERSPSPMGVPSSPNVIYRHQVNPDKKDDPFEDLLKAPPSKSSLRWSQELNPLYDYIRGVKVSPVYGYEVPSSLGHGSPNPKRPSPIEEEMDSDCRSSSSSQGTDGTVLHFQRRPLDYEEAMSTKKQQEREVEGERRRTGSSGSRPRSEVYQQVGMREGGGGGGGGGEQPVQSATLSGPLRRVKTNTDESWFASPRLGKRALPTRYKTVTCVDDSNAPQHRQRPQFAGDTMKVSPLNYPH